MTNLLRRGGNCVDAAERYRRRGVVATRPRSGRAAEPSPAPTVGAAAGSEVLSEGFVFSVAAVVAAYEYTRQMRHKEEASARAQAAEAARVDAVNRRIASLEARLAAAVEAKAPRGWWWR